MADLHDLLEKTSRTFALSIPYLPEPTRREVTVAYLLFRVADTFEDAAAWPREERIAALEELCLLLEAPRGEEVRRLAERWAAAVPVATAGYRELLAEVPFVLEAYFALAPAARAAVRDHTERTARGMARYVARTDERGALDLRDLEELRDYCYVVAGIVGEMLTELFLLGAPQLAPLATELRSRSRAFGEALQLVNILKDAAFDEAEGRSFLPATASRDEVFALARRDLRTCVEYILALQRGGADRGVVAFNAVNVLLAFATLDKVERDGPGSKITRAEVYAIVERMEYALAHDLPVLSLE